MSLFRCVKCGRVENTALSFHCGHLDDKRYLCSECDPDIGMWHGRFPKVSAEGMYYDENHYVYGPNEIDTGAMELKYNRGFKMVGRVIGNKMVDNGAGGPVTAKERVLAPNP
jgi:hypothetical protein